MNNTKEYSYIPENLRVKAEEVKKEEEIENPLVCERCQGIGYPNGYKCDLCDGTGGVK